MNLSRWTNRTAANQEIYGVEENKRIYFKVRNTEKLSFPPVKEWIDILLE